MKSIASTQLWVRDQDEAVEFWTSKVGFEIKVDATLPEMGGFRWVTVGPVGDSGTTIVLMGIPGEPMIDPGTKEKILELMSMGLAGTVFIGTDDCRADFEEMRNRGVEFTSEPEETPYGIDCGFTDPSGNSARLTQAKTEFV